MFPVSLSGSVRIANAHARAQAAAARIVDMLDEKADTGARAQGSEVVFERVPLFGMSRTNILGPFNAGSFQVETEDTALRVRYRLSTMRLLLFVTGAVGAIAGFDAWIRLAHHEDWREAVWVFAAGWLWLFGMNYVIAAIRIPLWLKRELRNLA